MYKWVYCLKSFSFPSEVTSTVAVGILLAFVTLYGIIITLVYLHLRRSNIALKQSVSAREGQRLDPYTSLDPTTMEHPAYDDTIATTRGDRGQMNAIEGVEYGNQTIVEHPYTSLDATTMEQPAYGDTIATTRGDRGQMNAIDGVEYRNQTIVEQTARVQQSILRVAGENTEPEYVLPI
ncbi:uncharacterized protein LOC105445761 [Strongylocentrotus purpuratus]|uniref:Uncharacterized protein n=1 Tax=Strongylocentrotus purpuratus TaxID=7668 RepID=A0A7M7NMN9_STRPU|nr:uncharacterized protein LOC105445761 [Strongylocentrotus purpuratus]